VLLVAVLLSSLLLAEDKPVEPTAGQLKKAIDEFARIGATYRAVTDLRTDRVTHWFGFASETRDTDLKNLPNSPFSFSLSLAGTQVTDAGLKELKEALPECRIRR